MSRNFPTAVDADGVASSSDEDSLHCDFDGINSPGIPRVGLGSIPPVLVMDPSKTPQDPTVDASDVASRACCSATPPRLQPPPPLRLRADASDAPDQGRRVWNQLGSRRQVKEPESPTAAAEDEMRSAGEAKGRLIVISCRLPVEITEVPDAEHPRGWAWSVKENDGEILAPALKHLRDVGVPDPQQRVRMRYLAVGWVGKQVEPSRRQELRNLLMSRHSCVPIFLEPHEISAFYTGFCKGVLWPLLHYSLQTQNFVSKFAHFGMFERVNKKYANAAMQLYRQSDVVWIHDYHLLLAAKTIRDRVPHVKLGLFVHTPFPHVELFKQLPVRKELLTGMLAADVVGFNSYSYCSHFEESCVALLGIDHGKGGLLTQDGRFVKTHTSPAGIDFTALKEMMGTAGMRERVSLKQQQFASFSVIVGRTYKLDHRAGTIQRFRAFEHLLRNHAAWRGKVVLLEIIDQPANTTDPHIQSLVQETLGRINGAYGELKDIGRPPPVHLIQPGRAGDKISKEEIYSHMACAHVIVITPLRDGLNLASHEAVVCQDSLPSTDTHAGGQGNCAPLILSEFAGASYALGGARTVNPYDENAMEREMVNALVMSERARKRNQELNLHYVQRNTAQHWAEECMYELIGQARDTRTGSSIDLLKNPATLDEMRSEYRDAKKRLLFLDWDGCLVSIPRDDRAAPPEVIEVLRALCADAANTVYVLTGRTREQMETLLEGLPIGIVAEHGAFIRLHGESDWLTVSGLQLSCAWMAPIEELLTDYSGRCPGSHVEKKEATMTWHWRDAEFDFANWIQFDLTIQLHSRMQEHPFTCFAGRRAVEITAQGCSKANAIAWLCDYENTGDGAFLFAVGDDRDDEDVFEALHAPLGESDCRPTWTPPMSLLSPDLLSKRSDIGQPAMALTNTSTATLPAVTVGSGKSPATPPLHTLSGIGHPRRRTSEAGSQNAGGRDEPTRSSPLSGRQRRPRLGATPVGLSLRSDFSARRNPSSGNLRPVDALEREASQSGRVRAGGRAQYVWESGVADGSCGRPRALTEPPSPTRTPLFGSTTERRRDFKCWTVRVEGEKAATRVVGESNATQHTHARTWIKSPRELMQILESLTRL